MGILKECETAYNVYKTFNYGLFKFIESNRETKRAHVDNLKEQIKDGYEMPPIIVRENGEILDGQHRYLALIELEEEVQFIVKNDIKKDVLQKSNSNVSKWTTKDHINFFKEEGNTNYKKLEDFINYSELSPAVAAKVLGKAKSTKGGSLSKAIQNGTFVVTSEEDAYQFIEEVVLKIRMDKPTTKILNSLRMVYNFGVDNKLLVTVVNALEEELLLLSKESKITERIVNLYNKKCDKNDRIKTAYSKNGNVILKI